MQKGKDKLEGAEDKVAWRSASSKITRDWNEKSNICYVEVTKE